MCNQVCNIESGVCVHNGCDDIEKIAVARLVGEAKWLADRIYQLQCLFAVMDREDATARVVVSYCEDKTRFIDHPILMPKSRDGIDMPKEFTLRHALAEMCRNMQERLIRINTALEVANEALLEFDGYINGKCEGKDW